MMIRHVLVVILSLLCACNLDGSSIVFGNKAASFVVKDGSMLEIDSAAPFEIEKGTFVNEGDGKVSGNLINFNRGVYTYFNSVSDLDGTLIPEKNIIRLGQNDSASGGTMLANPGGLSSVSVTGLPGQNILRGQPLFFGRYDLQFKDRTTGMALAIQNTLNTNILLKGGLLFLQDDLRLGDDAVIVDSGHVVFNNRRLSLGGSISVWNGRILWDSAQDLLLNSAVTLNGEWIFIGDGQINGNGNVIDLANGGSIIVLEDSSLRLAGVHIKGLGATGSIKLGANATLILSDAVIEMGSDYNISSGTIIVEGNSTVITGDHTLSFVDGLNGTNGKLIVDRVALTYDTLSSIDTNNVRPNKINDPTGKYIQLLGEGSIRTFRSDPVTNQNYKSNSLVQKYAIVAPYRKFPVFPEVLGDGSLNYDVTIDGNTNFLGFTFTEEGVFILTQNVHAVTNNIVMRDFSPNHLVFEPGSSLTFGNNTMITFARNETLTYPLIFEGKTIILKGVNGTNVRCESDTSKIILKNVKWIQSGDFSYSNGALEVLDDTTIIGGVGTVASSEPSNVTFSYQSTQPLSILADATLFLTRDMIFEYAPTDNNPDLFVLDSPSAALSISQTSLMLTTELSLTQGRFIVRDRNFVTGALTIGPNVLLDRPAGATLEQQAAG